MVSIIVIMAVLLLPKITLALDTGIQYGAETGLGSEDPRIIVAKIIRIFLGFLGVIALILIMYAGWLWMTSQGNEEKITQAKKILSSAIIGLLIILSAMGIVTFIMEKFLGATNGGDGGDGGGGGTPGGIGALGGGIVQSVYPEPNQKEVPRNTSIIVTFREKILASTICEQVDGAGNCLGGSLIKKENIRIFKTKQGDSCEKGTLGITGCEDTNITEVRAASLNGKTFVFTPVNYLGSPSEYIWYSVRLTNDLKKADGTNAFKLSDQGFEWSFEISNKLDLIPPQVKQGGVFPMPDNEKDGVGSSTPAVQASGVITIVSQPNVKEDAQVASVNAVIGPQATAVANINCQENGTLTVTIMSDNKTASLNKGAILLGSAVASGNSINFTDYFRLTLASGSFSAGNQWNVTLKAATKADTLTIGGTIYTFVSGPAGINQISIGANLNSTAANISAALGSNSLVNSTVANNIVTVRARLAGADGNNIIIRSSSSGLTITPASGHFEGGQDQSSSILIKDKKDKPRNSIIQINFNEAINPINISGSSDEVRNYIRVVNLSAGNAILSGQFIVSNQYSTVEFISDTECGVNACGEKIYCLPANSQLRVEIMAAGLLTCAEADCSTKSPFTTCGANNICQDSSSSSTPKNYPASSLASGIPNGIVDLALNSLDGNRNANAEGPVSYYNENLPAAAGGDNFQWSFYISDIVDSNPPIIALTDAANGAASINLTSPVIVNFSKLMMSSSLNTGEVSVNNGSETIKHKLVNLFNFANKPTGYWVASENIDDAPVDGEPDWTKMSIKHSDFFDATSYRAQVGSGVKDIYQNCYRPCAGPACSGIDLSTPSCCSGTSTTANGFDNKCSGSQ